MPSPSLSAHPKPWSTSVMQTTCITRHLSRMSSSCSCQSPSRSVRGPLGWSTTYGQFTSSPDWLMLSRVQLSEYDHDSSELRPHAPDRGDGGRWLRFLVTA